MSFDPTGGILSGLSGIIQGIFSAGKNKEEEEKERRSAEIEAIKSAWSPWTSLQPTGVYQAQKSSAFGDALGTFADTYDMGQKLGLFGAAQEPTKMGTTLKKQTLIEAPQAHQLEFQNEEPEMISSEAWDALRKQRAGLTANPWLAQISGGRLWG